MGFEFRSYPLGCYNEGSIDMVHNRQFILSKQIHRIGDDWCSLQLKNGYILSYQKNLHYASNKDKSILIIGDAWQVEKGQPSPEDIINSIQSFDESHMSYIDECECSWNGRYILITGDFISLDAVGAYGVYYSKNSLSSSLPLICHVENREVIYPETKWGKFPDFVPGPYTQIDGVKRIMPSQRYDYVSHKFFYHKFLSPLPDNIEERVLLEELSKMFEASLKNMHEHFGRKPIWLALTGGKDSRTALAFLAKLKLPFNCFTFVFSDSSAMDASIAKFASAKVGKKHYTISLDESRFSKNIYEEFNAHCMMMNVDGESVQFPNGMYNDLGDLSKGDFLLLRNNAWESIMDYYSAHFETTDELILKLRANGKNDKSVDEWLQWVQNDPLNSDISLWDRIFWEQREGCWLASIEQSLEIKEQMTSVQMCNCRKILSYLHAFPFAERHKKIENVMLIHEEIPNLCFVPFGNELHANESVLRGYLRKRFPRIWTVFRCMKRILSQY